MNTSPNVSREIDGLVRLYSQGQNEMNRHLTSSLSLDHILFRVPGFAHILFNEHGNVVLYYAKLSMMK